MLENPVYPAVLVVSDPLRKVGDVTGDNPSGAENQQERLKAIGWVVGFVDGEGCFSCSIYRCHRMTLKWQVRPSFDVVQGESSREALEGLIEFFGCGKIFRNRRRDNHREDLLRYNVYPFQDLRTKIVPFFRENPLRTSKRENFEKFVRIIELMELRRHLSVPRIIQIAEITQTMNHRKPSNALRILRDHTPALFEFSSRRG
jgi:LAGLIDADG endonuclease